MRSLLFIESFDLPSQHRCHTHFRNALTDNSYLKLPKYTAYLTNHPAGIARGGTAIIIKTTIKHHLQDFLQAVCRWKTQAEP
jgi:DNA topoisomerase VI subunit B